MNIFVIVLSVLAIGLSSFCLGYYFCKSQQVEVDTTFYANKAIDTLHYCLSHDSDYKGFKTRMDIVRWLEARRNKVQEALNRE